MAHVARLGQDADAPAGQFPARLLQGWQRATGKDQVAAFGGERPRDGQSDTAACAGNERDFVGQCLTVSN